MKLTYDPDADAAYLYLDSAELEVARTVPVLGSPFTDTMNIDLDAAGRIVGIEVLGATRRFPASVLAKAELLSAASRPGVGVATAE